MGNGSKSAAKKFVSIQGNVSIPGGSNFRGIAVDLISSRDGAYRQLPVATDGSFGENLKLKGGVTLTAKDINGKEPNFTRLDGISGNIGEQFSSTSLVLKPEKRKSYSAQIAFAEIPDPITGLPLPANPDLSSTGGYAAGASPNLAQREDLGVLDYGQTRSGRFLQRTETDWYRVALNSGQQYTFHEISTGGGQPQIMIFDANGNALRGAVGFNGGRVNYNIYGSYESNSYFANFSPPVTGTYFLSVGAPMGEVMPKDYQISFS